MRLRPTELVIFGNPKGGTPLMQDEQTAGIDLPLKVLAWEDEAGQVWLTYNDPAWLKCFLGVHAAWLSSSVRTGCWSGANGLPICDSTWAGVMVLAHRSASASRSWRS